MKDNGSIFVGVSAFLLYMMILVPGVVFFVLFAVRFIAQRMGSDRQVIACKRVQDFCIRWVLCAFAAGIILSLILNLFGD